MKINLTSKIISNNSKHYPVRSLSLPFDVEAGMIDEVEVTRMN